MSIEDLFLVFLVALQIEVIFTSAIFRRKHKIDEEVARTMLDFYETIQTSKTKREIIAIPKDYEYTPIVPFTAQKTVCEYCGCMVERGTNCPNCGAVLKEQEIKPKCMFHGKEVKPYSRSISTKADLLAAMQRGGMLKVERN